MHYYILTDIEDWTTYHIQENYSWKLRIAELLLTPNKNTPISLHLNSNVRESMKPPEAYMMRDVFTR